MEEMLARLERGEDPESLDEEFGEDEEDDDLSEWFRVGRRLASRARRRPPRRDETLYPLQPAPPLSADEA